MRDGHRLCALAQRVLLSPLHCTCLRSRHKLADRRPVRTTSTGWDCGERQVSNLRPTAEHRRGRDLSHSAHATFPKPAASSCVCCAVLFHRGPGEDCRAVPMWELNNWVCPDCSPTVQSSSLCGRVIYGFKNALTTALTPARARTYDWGTGCLLYTSPSPRDQRGARMPSSA